MTQTEPLARAARRRHQRRTLGFVAILVTVMSLLFGVPLWTLVLAPAWPAVVTVIGTLTFVAGALAQPYLMFRGHGRRSDPAAVGIALRPMRSISRTPRRFSSCFS